MKKITEAAVDAFLNHERFKRDNTEVITDRELIHQVNWEWYRSGKKFPSNKLVRIA